jgi:hypothetical protein
MLSSLWRNSKYIKKVNTAMIPKILSQYSSATRTISRAWLESQLLVSLQNVLISKEQREVKVEKGASRALENGQLSRETMRSGA